MKTYDRTDHTGNVENVTLDSIDGALLNDGDVGFVRKNNVSYEYVLDADSGAVADGITIIEPATNPGAKRWHLQKVSPYAIDTDNLVLVYSPTYYEAASTALDDHLAGIDAALSNSKVNLMGGYALMSVWSQKDTNGGLGTLTYENLAGGTFSAGDTLTDGTTGATCKVISDNGSNSAIVGSLGGVFQGGAQISNGGGVTADVTSDFDTGIFCDPCNNDNSGDWTQGGDSLTFDTDHYEFASSGANKKCYRNNALSFTEGKLYIVEAELKDGTASPTDLLLWIYDGATTQYSSYIDTTGAFVRYTWVFEATNTTTTGDAGIQAVTSLGGNNFEFKYFGVYEYTPCCTGNNQDACENCAKDSTLDIYREHYGDNVKDGYFYSLLSVPSAQNDYFRFPRYGYDEEWWVKPLRGKTITIAAYVKSSTASDIKLQIIDSEGSTESTSAHTGGGEFEWMTVTHTVHADATWLRWGYIHESATPGNAFVCPIMPIEGKYIAAGNFCVPPGQWVDLEVPITSRLLHGTSGWSDVAFTDLNIEADSEGVLPKGSRCLEIQNSVNDAASAGTDCYLALRRDSTQVVQYENRPYGKANDTYNFICGRQACDGNGDIDYYINASGANTFDITWFKYLSVQVT